MSTYSTPEYRPGNRRIVTFDGEGKTINGRHSYNLLAAADDRGYRDYIEHDNTVRPGSLGYEMGPYQPTDIAPNHGLSTKDMLDFMLNVPENPSDLLISFAATYDQTKFLQDLPYAALKEFADLGFTIWEGYVISGIPRKYFSVLAVATGKEVKIWDTFAYWQMSFAKALDASTELFSTEQQDTIDFIKRMKLDRSHFDTMDADEIREYCFNECEYLSIMFRDLLKHCDEMGLKPGHYGGPGGIAMAFFTSTHLKDYMPDGSPHSYLAGLPASVAINSIYGGHFETTYLGPIGDVIELDIQSAYPAIAVSLPCLKHGRFKRVNKFVPNKWGFYYVGSHTTGPWAPFPFRADSETGKLWLNGAAKGSIAFVHGGKRWVTSAEVEKAIKYFGVDAIPIYSGWVFNPGCNHRPFQDLLKHYLRRKIGDPTCIDCINAEEHFCPEHPSPSEGLSKIIKLILNSVYGKLMQSIGWKLSSTSPLGVSEASSYNAPEYQCYIWAAWITGGTRARVMEAAMLGGRENDCPECFDGDTKRACFKHFSVVSIATDGILTFKDIPGLYITDWELGTWERKLKPDCWLGMPGIYCFGRTPDEKKYKRRGLDSRYFPALHLREAWERGQWKVRPIGEPKCPECVRLRYACPDHPMRGFMPLKLAMQRVNALDVMGEWVTMVKTVKFLSVQHKRNLPESVDPFMPHDGSPIQLEAISIPDDVKSAPFEPKQTWDDVKEGRIDDPDIAMWTSIDDTPEYAGAFA
jgi:hypothetical protein